MDAVMMMEKKDRDENRNLTKNTLNAFLDVVAAFSDVTGERKMHNKST